MATELGRAKSTPASKYDALVASHLAQAEKRIRILDLRSGEKRVGTPGSFCSLFGWDFL
jgi:hypothetical protein